MRRGVPGGVSTDLAEKPTKTRGVWESLSWSLRYGAVACGCVLLIAAVVYLVIRLAVLVAPLTLAIIVALLLAALLQPIADAVRRLRAPDSVAALAAIAAMLAVIVLPAV